MNQSAVLLAGLLLAGACTQTHPGAEGGDAGVTFRVAHTALIQPGGDAPALDDALSAEEAACLGLDAPACATCHLQDGAYRRRPVGVGAPPPDVMAPTLGSCVADAEPEPRPEIEPTPAWEEISADDAECYGLTQAPCASCHVQDGRYYLRPKNVPPPPPDLALPAPRADCDL